MSKEYVQIGNGPLQPLETKPLTVVVPAADFHQRIKYLDRVDISCNETLAHIHEVDELHPHTQRYFRIVFPEYGKQFDLETIRRDGNGAQHVAGLIDLSLKLNDQGKKFVWKYPESFLRPTQQLQLGDLAVAFMKLCSG